MKTLSTHGFGCFTTPSVLETLEARLAPAGIVAVTLTPGGNLTLTGDAADNGIQISGEDAPGFWTLSSTDGDTLFSLNGAAAVSGLVIAAPGGNVKVNGNAGNDVLFISGASVGGELRVDMGEGDSQVVFSGSVDGRTIFNSGGGRDHYQVAGIFGSAFTISSGGGGDSLQLTDVSIQGPATFNLGHSYDPAADNNLFLSGSVQGRTTVNGGDGMDFITLEGTFDDDVRINTGDNLDVLIFNGGVINGDLIASFGSGSSSVSLMDTSSTMGGLTINGDVRFATTGDSTTFHYLGVEVTNGLITGDLTYQNQDGTFTADVVTPVDGQFSVLGNLNLRGGDSGNSAAITANLHVGGRLTVDFSGSTADNFFTGGAQDSTANISLGSFVYRGGSAADLAVFSTNTLNIGGDVTFHGQGGENTLFGTSVQGTTIGGDVNYTGGEGTDSFGFWTGAALTIGGDIRINNGAGQNVVSLSAETGGDFGSLTVQSAAVNTGDNAGCGVYLYQVRTPGDVTLNLGGGTSSIEMIELEIGGDLTVRSAGEGLTEYYAVQNAEITGGFTLTSTGGAATTVNVDNAVVGGLVKISTGGGADTVNLDVQDMPLLLPELPGSGSLRSLFYGGVTILLGEGDDVFTAGRNPATVSHGNDFFSSLRIVGGTGNDTASFLSGYGNTLVAPPVILGVETVA